MERRPSLFGLFLEMYPPSEESRRRMVEFLRAAVREADQSRDGAPVASEKREDE